MYFEWNAMERKSTRSRSLLAFEKCRGGSPTRTDPSVALDPILLRLSHILLSSSGAITSSTTTHLSNSCVYFYTISLTCTVTAANIHTNSNAYNTLDKDLNVILYNLVTR